MASFRLILCVFFIAVLNFHASAGARQCYQCSNCNEVTDLEPQICPPRPTTAPPTDDTTTEDPITEGTTTEDPITEGTTTEDPITEGTTTEDPITEGTTTEDPITEGTTTEDPITEGTTTEDPITEGTTTEDPITEGTTTEDPITEGTTTEDPITEGTTTEDPITEGTTTEDPITEGTTTEDPITEGTTTEDPITPTQNPEAGGIGPDGETRENPAKEGNLNPSASRYRASPHVLLRTLKQMRDDDDDASCIVIIYDNAEGESQTDRGCVYTNEDEVQDDEARCREFIGGDEYQECDICDEDGCNSAGKAAGAVLLLAITLAINQLL